MTIIVSDTFTEAAGNVDLASHTPDVGSPWVEAEDSTGATILQAESATDRMSPSVGTASARIIYTSRPNPTSAAYDVQLSHVAGSPNGSDDPWFLVARFSDTSNYYSAGTYTDVSAADKKIFKIVAGVKTELASGDAGQAIGDTLKFEVRDATKKLFRNGSEALSTTDNALTSAGSAGVGFGNAWSVAADDINASWDMDDYSVDEVAAASASLVCQAIQPALMAM